MTIPIFVINLDRSPERMEAMVRAFPHDELLRFKAIDGGTCDSEKRNVMELIPPERGCAQSHIAVWEHIVKNGIDCAIVLEDDVEPVDKNKSLEFVFLESITPKIEGFEVLFLQENYRRSCYSDDNCDYRTGWGAHAYVITLEGAKKSLKAMEPITLPVDVQWMLAFEKCGMFCDWCEPKKNIKAKALKTGIVRHSSFASKSTFSKDGEKKWTDDRFKGGY